MQKQNRGLGWQYAVGCFVIWGMFPLYWYPLNQSTMPAEQLLAQRVLWSAVFALLFLTIFRHWQVFGKVWCNAKVRNMLFCSSVLIAINWLVYLWAILNHRVLDASLGYCINPLFNVFLGRIFLKEKLNSLQITAIVFAGLGILWLAIPAGQIPWVALLLASSFGIYGLVRKIAPVDALSGLAVETVFMLPFALAYLIFTYVRGDFIWQELSHFQAALLFGSGLITVVPLLMFAAAAHRISLSLLGILQYISPTVQFFLGLFLFEERLDEQKLLGFILVWMGVLVFLYSLRKKRAEATQ